MKTGAKFQSTLYWLVFVLAVYSITQFFGGYRYFQFGSELEGYLMNTMWLLIFLASMIFLAYVIYSEERAKDNIRAEFAPFEKLYMAGLLRPSRLRYDAACNDEGEGNK